MDELVAGVASAFQHQDAVEPRHRFPSISFRGETWELAHLDAFAIRMDPGLGFEVDVVILFTCHCFSHSFKWDSRAPLEIPNDEVFDNGHERRVLSRERYELSRRFLPHLIKDIEKRLVRYAGDGARNYFTAEDLSQDPTAGKYAIFFEVERDRKRKRRLLLRIQSAYRPHSAIAWQRRQRLNSQRFCGRPTKRKRYARRQFIAFKPRKDNGHTRWPPHARFSIAFYRELPLQVGPGFPGGAAYCARSWQILSTEYKAGRADIKSGSQNLRAQSKARLQAITANLSI